MTQSAHQGSSSAISSATDLVREKAVVVAKRTARMALSAWAMGATGLAGLIEHSELLRLSLAPLALPPVFCAVILMYTQGTEPQWGLVVLTLLASAFALTGVAAVAATRHSGFTILIEAWSAPQPRKRRMINADDQYALRLGSISLALAVVCALPLAFSGKGAFWLVVAFGALVVVFFGADVVRLRAAPLDEPLAALSLGPGLVALTVLSQGQTMTARDWFIAVIFGCMAFGVIEGRRLGATAKENARRGRTLASLIGSRRALLVAGGAMALGFALVVAMSVLRPTLPGALLALIAAPMALVALTGLGVSHYAPSRRMAAHQLMRVYTWFGAALIIGLVATLLVQGFIGALVHSLIG